MNKTARYALLLVLGLSTPGLLADDSDDNTTLSSNAPVSHGPQAPGWDAYNADAATDDLPTVLEIYTTHAYALASLTNLEKEQAKDDDEFKRHWTARRHHFRYHFAQHMMLGLGFKKNSKMGIQENANIRGFQTAIILEWD